MSLRCYKSQSSTEGDCHDDRSCTVGSASPISFSLITLPLAAAIGAPLMAGSAAMAQTYPSQLIKVICPPTSGSPIDVTARLVTNDLSNRLGKPVIVENRPGGGGTIGVGEFTRAAPDGHTLLCGAIGDAFASKVVGRDPAKDFIPVATVARISGFLS